MYFRQEIKKPEDNSVLQCNVLQALRGVPDHSCRPFWEGSVRHRSTDCSKEGFMYEKGYRNVEYSRTEVSRCLRYPDINGQGRLFGGRLLAWIDEIAAIAATRHAGVNVTTAAIEHLEFKCGAYLNDVLVLIANVTHVGRTSIEVRVDTYIENQETGFRYAINRAFLTEVCIDESGKPTPVPYGLTLETESEKARWAGAEKRIESRKKAAREGY